MSAQAWILELKLNIPGKLKRLDFFDNLKKQYC